MASKINLLKILTLFAQKQNSGHIHFPEFTDYMRRYAQHHIADKPEVAPFLTNTELAMQKELEKLEDQHLIIITNPDNDKRGITVIPFYIEKYTACYREILNNPTIPFPIVSDLPKQAPSEIIERKQAAAFLVDLLDKLFEETNETSPKNTSNGANALYGLVFPNDIPVLIFPSATSAISLFDIALAKIRQKLRKDEFHDYFLKKIKVSNPGKELSVKTFFTQFIQKPTEILDSIKRSGEPFYFLSQLCFFLRQDYEKIKDYTQEDLSILQSVYITEIAAGFYKNKAQQGLQRSTALKNLEQLLDKPPSYFTKEAIELFTDSRGIPLLGQYGQEELNEFLHNAAIATNESEIPNLLTFKIPTGERYYIYKSKVIPLVVRLCNDARETIKSNLTKSWFTLYKNFDTVTAMADQKSFEKCLENEIKVVSPILFALLNSNFLSLVHYDTQNSKSSPKDKISLFASGKLLPYGELLMISRREISTDAKILLPFWFAIPVISFFARLLFSPPKSRRGKVQTAIATTQMQLKGVNDIPDDNSTKNIRRQEFRAAATVAESKLVPPGSTIDREMDSYSHQWNRLLDKQLNKNLLEDVNSLVRDYMRKTLRTLKSSTFTLERIQNLADIVMTNPAFQKITDKEQLKMYIVLYIVRIIKNL